MANYLVTPLPAGQGVTATSGGAGAQTAVTLTQDTIVRIINGGGGFITVTFAHGTPTTPSATVGVCIPANTFMDFNMGQNTEFQVFTSAAATWSYVQLGIR